VTVGYPDNAARPGAPFITSEVDGWIPTGSGLYDSARGRRAGFLTLKAEGSPPRPLPTHETELGSSVWAGMSGAAVFAGNLLVGVVAEHHLPEGDGSLTVVPIEWADQLVGVGRTRLMQALGVDSVAGMERLTGAPMSVGAGDQARSRPKRNTDPGPLPLPSVGRIVERMLNTEELANPSSLHHFLSLLPADILGTLPYASQPRAQLVNVVRRCRRAAAAGREALVNALSLALDGTELSEVLSVLDSEWPPEPRELH
jgi:hypothetical protein